MESSEFDALYTQHHRALYNTVYRWLWHPQDSEDVVHEAFARFWERRDEISLEHQKAYLFRMAVNLASRKRRWKKLRRFVGLEEEAMTVTDAERDLLGKENAQRVAQALDDLSEKQRSTLLMIRFGEMSYKEAALVLGISEGTVASRLHHATKTLKEALDGS